MKLQNQRLTMSNFVILILIFSFSLRSCQGDSYGVLHATNAQNRNQTRDFCVAYNQHYQELALSLEKAEAWYLTDLTPSYFCTEPKNTTIAEDINGTAVAVQRGNCTFALKAELVQSYGGKALIAVSPNQVIPGDDNETIYQQINITVVVITSSDFEKVQSLGDKVTVQLYIPTVPLLDFGLLLVFLVAVGTVFTGALWSGILKHEQYLRKKRLAEAAERRECDEDEEEEESEPESMDISPKFVVVFVILICAMLISLYFFYDYLVYLLIALFVVASSMGLFFCLQPLILKSQYFRDCRVPENRIPLLRQRPSIMSIILYFCCVGLAVFWAVQRHASYAWILQDLLGIAFCIHVMKMIRLPNLQACTILLVLLLIYDVFFVFVTPLFTKGGKSVMVDVATGGSSSSGEELPMVMKIPRISKTADGVCSRPYFLLGFGDILVPALLISFLHGFDLKVSSRRIYFISTVIAYAVGLLLTFVAMLTMSSGQPALLYLVPCTLLTTFVIGCCRRELKHLWKNQPTVKPEMEDSERCEDQTADRELQTEDDEDQLDVSTDSGEHLLSGR